MSVLEEIKWSETDYGMKDFVEFFGYSLPLLCQTTSGYAGCDDDIHQIGADEIYWIYDIQRQMRVVAKDSNHRYISIPVNCNKYKFQIISEDKSHGSVVSSQQLLESMQKDQFSKIRFKFKNDRAVSYQFGADTGSVAQFGTLELEKSYEEKYLLGYALHNDHIFYRTVGIPVYMDVSFTRALGFLKGDNEGQKFHRWTKEVKALIDSLEKTEFNICQAIIVFPKRPSDDDYEYLRPNIFLRDSLKKQPISDPEKNENEYSYIMASESNLKSKSKNESETLTPTATEIQMLPLPPMPRRLPPNPPLSDESRPRGAGLVSQKVDDSDPGEAPPIPSRQLKPKTNYQGQNLPKNRSSESSRFYTSLQSDSIHENTPIYDPLNVHQYYSHLELSIKEAPPKEAPTPSEFSLCPKNPPSDFVCSPDQQDALSVNETHPEDQASEISLPLLFPIQKEAPDVMVTTSADVAGIGSRLAGYASAAQVPVDENIESWTVDDVTELLRMMKMSQYCEQFVEHDIDGALLANLDQEILVQDFGFKHFEATKVVMFIKKGWRPK